jgi:Thioredoxin
MSGDVERCCASALTFEKYRAQLRIHVSAFNEHYERLAFVLDEERGKAPVGNSRILILTEEYCIDSVLNVPLIARLVEASPDAALRITRRDEHLKLAARFPGRGGTSRLPTVIFLGRSRQVLGYWSERAECAHRWMGTFVAQDPMPELILEDGQPTPRLAPWMDRRFSSQRVIFEAQGWRSVRDELHALANSATADSGC